MNKRYWLIRRYDSTELIFEKKVNLGQLTEKQMRRLLQTLAAKESLSYSEIVGAYAKPGAVISNDLLAVHKDFSHATWMCGSNPHFTAKVVEEGVEDVASRKGHIPPSPEGNGTDFAG
ncbi:MAG: hypothetical protein ACRD2P_02375 [Terriglobia bacterium]